MDFVTKTLERKVKPYLQHLHQDYLKFKKKREVRYYTVPVISEGENFSRPIEETNNSDSSTHIYLEPFSSSEFTLSSITTDVESYGDRLENGSSDSGLGKTPDRNKIKKRIHFSTDLNLIHKYEGEYNEQSHNSDCSIYSDNSLMKQRVKLTELPLPQRPQIISRNQESINSKTHSFRRQNTWSGPAPRNLNNTSESFKRNRDSNKYIYSSTPNSSIQSITPPPKPPRKAKNLVSIKYSANIHERSEYLSIIMPLSGISKAPIYTDITPSTSSTMEDILPSESNNSIHFTATLQKSEPIYAQITPKSIRNSTISFVSSATTSADNSTENDELLSKETKEKLNLIHKTNWALTRCAANEEKPIVEDRRFIINAFESRASKRWENYMRSKDTKADNESDMQYGRSGGSCSRNIRSADTTRDFTSNFSLDYDDVDENITKLEKESRGLKEESKKIQRELARLQHEELERHYNKLENDKKKIDWRISQIGDDSKTTTEYTSLLNESQRIEEELELIKERTTAEYKRYRMLKKARDIECTRMSQASNALIKIKDKSGERDWLDVLVAERLLLETSEKVKLYTSEIRDTMYSSIQEPIPHKAKLRLSDISFPFLEHFRAKFKADRYFTDFFVVTISHGTQMEISEYMTGEEEPLTFSKNWIFDNVRPDFEIKVKLFCLRLRTLDEYIWDKITWCTLCPTSRILYEDLLTRQYEEKKVYKTSFKLCAAVTLTRSHIDENCTKLELFPEVFSKLDNILRFNLKCEQTHIDTNLCGFLDFGIQRGDVLLWERKWCLLRSTNLYIYSYPQDEYLGNPFEQLNLEYCFGSVVTNLSHCPKKRAFQLKTGRPIRMNCNSTEKMNTMRTKPNFFVERYYFAAGSMVEYLKWTEELEKILDSLSDFKKLVFKEEYVQYQSSS